MSRAVPEQETLEKLVSELMKDQPSQAIVKKLSRSLGMPYSGDSMTQMNTVLNSMNSVYLRANRGKELES